MRQIYLQMMKLFQIIQKILKMMKIFQIIKIQIAIDILKNFMMPL